jgi:CRP/FNR family cyclic AMP-dependent transcriptional regulator
MERRITHSLVSALRAVPSLGRLDDRTLLTIVGDSANLRWQEGTEVFAKGSPADGLYIVISGGVRVLGDNGAEIAVLAPGAYFGEFSLLLGSDHGHDVVALEDSELMVVPKDRFDAIMAEHPDLAQSIHDTAEARRAATPGAS